MVEMKQRKDKMNSKGKINSKSEFLYGAANTEAVKMFFEGSQNLDVAVAFWGEEIISSLKESLKNNPQRKLRIICNPESGAVNPKFLTFCLSSKQIEIRENSKLHSKVIFTDKKYIVGSANISSNGLGHEDGELHGWMESSIAGNDKNILFQIENWFLKEWDSALAISRTNLKRYEDIWAKKRNQRKPTIKPNTKVSLLDAVLKEPSSFKDRSIYLAIYRNDLSKEGCKKFEEIKKGDGIKDLAPFEEWEIPEDAHLIEIYFGRRGKVEINNMVYVSANPMRAEIKYDGGAIGEMIFGKYVKDIAGYKTFCTNKHQFKKCLPIIWESIKDNGDDDGRLVRLDRIVKFFK